jgi:hypothetical protein
MSQGPERRLRLGLILFFRVTSMVQNSDKSIRAHLSAGQTAICDTATYHIQPSHDAGGNGRRRHDGPGHVRFRSSVSESEHRPTTCLPTAATVSFSFVFPSSFPLRANLLQDHADIAVASVKAWPFGPCAVG